MSLLEAAVEPAPLPIEATAAAVLVVSLVLVVGWLVYVFR